MLNKIKHKKKILVLIVLVILAVVGLIIWNNQGEITKPKVVEINETTYQFTDGMNSSHMYLVIGSEKAILIDTGNGLSDLKAAVKEITDLPVSVVNTHGHYDHTHGNYQFDSVYMSVKDDEVLKSHNDPKVLKSMLNEPGLFIRMLIKPESDTILSVPVSNSYTPLPEEGYFELGDRKIKIIETPGHTPGSISLLDEKNGILFAGDTVTKSLVLLNRPESLSVKTYRNTIENLIALSKEASFSEIYGGHAEMPVGIETLEIYKEICDQILSGNVSDMEKDSHEYKGVTLDFNPEKIQSNSVDK